MNKKFFAALASATMAFTASGSIAVFADDFVEESNVVTPGDLQENPTKVVFNKANFGALVEAGAVKFKKADTNEVVLEKDKEVETSKLEEIAAIELQAGFEGEVRGLEYFTKLTSFTAETGKVTNEALDFSANTKLETLSLTKANELAEIKLPKAFVNDKKEEEYSLKSLKLVGTKLTKLDLSAQDKLVKDGSNGSVVVKRNKSLKELTLKTATAAKPAKLTTLDLAGNALETINLDNYEIETKLDLGGNHIGALDLSKTTAPKNATLGTQVFYVYEKAANVNLKETFANLDVDYVTSAGFNSETGVLDLADATNKYTYNTRVGGADTKTITVNLNAANPMNRLYNPNSGEHFYTADIKEKEALVNLGWNDEGYGWVAAPTKGAKEEQAVYRLYNPNAGDHHYTMSEDERDTLVAYGWKDEKVGWYSAAEDKTPVYRQYNPYANGAGSHNYTTDKAENNYLVSLGWIYEGKAWFALQ